MKKIIPISCLSISLIAILLFFQACVKDLEKEGINNTTQYIGTVVEKSTMQPVAGVSVQITDGSHVQAVDVTDSNGRFTLRDINFDELDDNYYLWLDATSLDLPSKQEPLMGLGEKIYDYKNIILYDKTNVDLLPRITTGEIGDTLALSAKVSGNDVTFDGGHEISARGICYATHQTPTLEDSVIIAGTGLGEFSVNMRNLTKSTTYYVRAYATNNIATTFGAQRVFTTQSGVATLTTNDATNLTATTATISGSVSDDGGDAITVRGFCYAKTQEPTINDSVTTDGSDTGSFVRTLRGLEVNTTYYYRPYATNTCGTSYGPQKSFKTSSGLPEVTTTAVSDITATTAKSGGNISFNGGFPVTARGVCWNTQGNPEVNDNHTTNGSGDGSFHSNITGLQPGTIYFMRAYATNRVGTSYGEETKILTLSGVVSLTVSNVTSFTASSAVCGGNITDDGGSAITERGLCWSTSHNPTTSGSHASSGSGMGSFTITMGQLTPGTTYYVRAYAKNGVGTSYSTNPEVSFTTADGKPRLTTSAVNSVTATTAKCGGNITDNGGFAVTARGVCWNTMGNPVITDNHTTNGSGNGSFTSNITGLAANTTYHVRAYATNSVTTNYGRDTTFTTLSGIVELTVNEVTNKTATSATCGGNITNDGGSTVTERGICWSTSQYPTISGNHSSSGSGTGSFTITMGQLTPGTTYYVRAYATNGVRTSYSTNQVHFTTTDGKPRLTTSAVNSVTATTAKCGGNITENGGFAVTARGVCWNTQGNPEVTDNHTTNGNGNGSFTSNITGLAANTTYHVRAYATNSVGTSYGRDTTFTTLSGIVELSVNDVANITATSATCGGNITNDGGSAVTERGICWSTSQYPTISGNHSSSGSGTGSFTITMGQLTPGTTYYVRAYATNGVRTCYSTNQVHFTTTDGKPRLTTSAVNSVTATTAICGGNITDNGGYAVTARGICWNTQGNPEVTDNHTTNGNGNGSFTSNITGLAANTTYHVRAYATNSIGTRYGAEETFTTKSGVAQLSLTRTSITATSAIISVNISGDGGSAITARGICWSTSNNNPTISDSHTTDGTGTGSFSATMRNLSPATTYHVRAYATNGIQRTYSSSITIQTTSGKPVLGDLSITNVTDKTVSYQCTVTNDEYPVIERGICWATTPQPTVSNSKSTAGSGTGAFSGRIENLTRRTTYYARAYAKSERGTSYSEQKTFTTQSGFPAVSTIEVINASFTSTTIRGRVTDDGGNQTERGICWSIYPTPSYNDAHVSCSSGLGEFTCTATGYNLHANSLYIRAYAKNDAGIAYGDIFTLPRENPNKRPTVIHNGYTYVIGGLQSLMPGSSQAFKFDEAQSFCNDLTFDGATDWFLPSIDELSAIISTLGSSLGIPSDKVIWSNTFNRQETFTMNTPMGRISSITYYYKCIKSNGDVTESPKDNKNPLIPVRKYQ